MPVQPPHPPLHTLPYHPPRVLIVEDVAGLRRAMRRALESAGYAVDTEGSGEWAVVTAAKLETDALEYGASSAHAIAQVKARGDKYSAAIIDYHLPGMNGVTLAAKLWEICPSLQVVFISGSGPSNFPQGARILEKPFSLEAMVAEIDLLTGTTRSQ